METKQCIYVDIGMIQVVCWLTFSRLVPFIVVQGVHILHLNVSSGIGSSEEEGKRGRSVERKVEKVSYFFANYLNSLRYLFEENACRLHIVFLLLGL